MINSVYIYNIQSHKETVIELSHGVNAFIGSSDSGKTAIFRAINWVVNNSAPPDFINWEGGDPCVALNLEEGVQVSRLRIKNENFYTITPPNKNHKALLKIIAKAPQKRKSDEIVLTAFGTKVPEEVSSILNMSDINFQFQLGGPFLLGQPPGAVAKYLNKVVDLDIIDVALFNINKRLKEEEGQLSHAKADQTRVQSELKEYEWLEEAEGCLAKLEAWQQSVIADKAKSKELNQIIFDLKSIDEKIKALVILKYEPEVNRLLELNAEIEKEAKEADELEDLIQEIKQIDEKLKQFDYLRFESEVNQLIPLDSEIEALKKEAAQLEKLLDQIEAGEKALAEMQEKLDQREREYHKLMPSVCPLCGAKKEARNARIDHKL